jgi:hypothetical protein
MAKHLSSSSPPVYFDPKLDLNEPIDNELVLNCDKIVSRSNELRPEFDLNLIGFLSVDSGFAYSSSYSKPKNHYSQTLIPYLDQNEENKVTSAYNDYSKTAIRKGHVLQPLQVTIPKIDIRNDPSFDPLYLTCITNSHNYLNHEGLETMNLLFSLHANLKKCCQPWFYYKCANGHEHRVRQVCLNRACDKPPCVKRRKDRVLKALSKVLDQFERQGLNLHDPRTCPKHIMLSYQGHHGWTKSLKKTLDGYVKTFVNEFYYRCERIHREKLGLSPMSKELKKKLLKKKLRGIKVPDLVPHADGFYVHFHFINDGDYIPQEDLSDVWFEISGSSYVYVKPVTKKYARDYLVKRSASPISLNIIGQNTLSGKTTLDNSILHALSQYVKHVYRTKFYTIFGDFDVPTLKEEMLCPKCNMPMLLQKTELEQNSEFNFVIFATPWH